MNGVALTIASILIFACLGGLFLGWKTFFAILKSHKQYLEEVAENTWVVVCGLPVRTAESLLMKNNGDDPCAIKEGIPYVNYIKDISLLDEVCE